MVIGLSGVQFMPGSNRETGSKIWNFEYDLIIPELYDTMSYNDVS